MDRRLPSLRPKKKGFNPLQAIKIPTKPVQSSDAFSFNPNRNAFSFNPNQADNTQGVEQKPIDLSMPRSPAREMFGKTLQQPTGEETGTQATQGYWQKPVFGKMPLDKFVQLAGGLSYAISPDTPMGRAGGVLSSFAGQERKAFEVLEDKARIRREKLEDYQRGRKDVLSDYEKEREDKSEDYQMRRKDDLSNYDRALEDKREDIASQRKYNEPLRSLQIQNLTRQGRQSAPQPWAATYNELKGKVNLKTGTAYTTPEILEIYNEAGEKNKVDIREINYKEEQAFKSLNSELSSLGGFFDTDTRSLVVPTDESGNISKEIKDSLEKSGFEYNEGNKIASEDKKGLFTGNDYSKQVFIGQYNPEKSVTQEAPPVPGAKQAPDGNWYVNKNGKWYPVLSKEKKSGGASGSW